MPPLFARQFARPSSQTLLYKLLSSINLTQTLMFELWVGWMVALDGRSWIMSHDVDLTTGHGERPVPGSPQRWTILVLVCLAQFMLILDVTVVNVALPQIGQDLSLGREALTWVVTAYALTFGGLMLLGGRLADVLGRRPTFLAGLIVFTVASLVTGLASEGTVLVAGRIAQGIGAALLSPAALALVTTTFHGSDRHRALGAWAAIGGTGSAVGVLVGGLLTSGPGWEWVFFINVPVGVAVLIGVLAVVPAAPGTGSTEPSASRVNGRLDVPGAVVVTGATGLLILGVTRAGADGWGATLSWLPLVGALAGYGAFVLIERAVKTPLVPLDLFTRRPVVAGAAGMLVATGLLISCFFLGSLYLQRIAGLSALQTGAVFLPVAIVITLAAHLASRLIGRFGPRLVATAGLIITAAGMAWLTRLTMDGGAGALLPGLLLAAAGVGPTFVAATTTAMSHVRHDEAGVASGVINTFHELGGGLGVAAVSALSASSLVPSATTVDGFTTAFLGCAIAAALGALLMLALAPAGRLPDGGARFVH
jgi:EmrB/QacA subfamily drug resistance transporter